MRYEPEQYWADRFRRYGMSMKSCACFGYPDELNHATYVKAGATVLQALTDTGASLDHVLEVGVGNGWWTRWLRTAGAKHLVGMDITDVLFEHHRAAFPKWDFIKADITQTGPPGRGYTLAMMLDVGQHIVDDADLGRALGHVRDAVRPGGVVLVTAWGHTRRYRSYEQAHTYEAYTSRFPGWAQWEPKPYRDKHLLGFVNDDRGSDAHDAGPSVRAVG